MQDFNPQAKDENAFVEWFGRAGYAAKGFVYGAIGVLALMQLTQAGGGQVAGSKSALIELDQQPYGDILLYAIAIGLVAYTLWRWAQGFFDVEHKGSDKEALVKRAGLVISGAIYGFLAFTAFRLAQSAGSSQGGSQEEKAAEVMSLPGGEWLIIAIGVGFIVAGLYQLFRAWKQEFTKHWKPKLSGTTQTWATRISRFGIAARAVILVIMGGYITNAGLQSSPDQTRGLGETLRSFADDPWLLGVTAAGLVCYAVYCFMNATIRRIPAST